MSKFSAGMRIMLALLFLLVNVRPSVAAPDEDILGKANGYQVIVGLQTCLA
ncbi:hypothetical protein AB7783_07795 [Tardiphaga sp. 172_B4_N1_3]|jgi:hypothetical protein|uniref:hypothetical protein n=1 Tax=Tardiphaga sp. 172_B4_N1_3 TaxID=3240787 RepID=UPI003F8B5586